jgi:hypothetical protein
MGEETPVTFIEASGLPAAEQEMILNAADRLLPRDARS